MEEETIDLPADNIKDKKEKIRKLVEEGYTNREIADRTGIPFGTVGYHAARFRKKEKEPVDNSDRHLCKTCKFRSNRPTVNSCDYTQSLIIRFFHRNLLSSCAKSMRVQFITIV